MPKRRKKPTIRARQVIAEYIANGFTAKGMKGYANDGTASSSVCQVIKHNKTFFSDALRKAGLDEDYIADKIRELTNAEKTVFFQKDGVVIEHRNCTDNQTRLGAIALASKLLAPQEDKNINLNHSGMIGHIDALEALSDKELSEEILKGEKLLAELGIEYDGGGSEVSDNEKHTSKG